MAEASEDLYACFQQPFMLTSDLLDERNIPQPAFGTLLPCRKGEGKGMRVATALPDAVGQQ
jgi:hypothetical protein